MSADTRTLVKIRFNRIKTMRELYERYIFNIYNATVFQQSFNERFFCECYYILLCKTHTEMCALTVP